MEDTDSPLKICVFIFQPNIDFDQCHNHHTCHSLVLLKMTRDIIMNCIVEHVECKNLRYG